MTVTLGIDFSLARPDPHAVYAAGYRIVMGYLSSYDLAHPSAKDLSAAWLAAYRAAGLQVGTVWEKAADRALSGAAGGAIDGAAAEAEANAIGYPRDCVIFAAVDFPATPAQIDGPIRDYMVAFDAATRRPVGVYGSFYVVSRLCTPGRAPIAYAWQTMAWSRDSAGNDQLWQPGHLYQRLAHTHPIAGVTTSDWDENVLLNPLPLMGATALPEVDVQLTDKISFTRPSDGQVVTYTVAEWIAWADWWAGQAASNSQALVGQVTQVAAQVAGLATAVQQLAGGSVDMAAVQAAAAKGAADALAKITVTVTGAAGQ